MMNYLPNLILVSDLLVLTLLVYLLTSISRQVFRYILKGFDIKKTTLFMWFLVFSLLLNYVNNVVPNMFYRIYGDNLFVIPPTINLLLKIPLTLSILFLVFLRINSSETTKPKG